MYRDSYRYREEKIKSKKICEFCDWFVREWTGNNDYYGHCHLNPPNGNIVSRPRIGHWCSHFKEREVEEYIKDCPDCSLDVKKGIPCDGDCSLD